MEDMNQNSEPDSVLQTLPGVSDGSSLGDEMPKFPFADYESPVPLELNTDEICSEVASIRKELGLDIYSSDMDVPTLVERLGGKLVYRWQLPFAEYQAMRSCIVIESDSEEKYKFKIYAMAGSDPKMQRFDICHELGHYFLHYKGNNQRQNKKKIEKLCAARSGDGVEEIEANRFALHFLLDKDDFIKKYKDFYGDPYLMTHHYQLPLSVLKAYSRQFKETKDYEFPRLNKRD